MWGLIAKLFGGMLKGGTGAGATAGGAAGAATTGATSGSNAGRIAKGLLSSGSKESQGDSGMGMSAAGKTAEDMSMLDKFQDYSQRYEQGKDSNLGRFIKDTKEGNYAGSLGYAAKLAQGAQQGAKPIPLIQLPQQQQQPVDDRYGRLYRRYRG